MNLSSFQVQIAVAEQKFLVGGDEVVTLRRLPPACLLNPNRYRRSWGKVRSDESEDWMEMMEITEELTDRSGLLCCATVVTCEWIPILVLNILSDPRRVRKGQSLADCIEASVVADAVNELEDADADADGHASVTAGVTNFLFAGN